MAARRGLGGLLRALPPVGAWALWPSGAAATASAGSAAGCPAAGPGADLPQARSGGCAAGPGAEQASAPEGAPRFPRGPRGERQEFVVGMLRHAWSGGYAQHCWGKDELHPLSNTCDNGWRLGLTLIDSLDTLYLFGMDAEFQAARDWVADRRALDFGQVRNVNLFETTIRVLGGLLGAYTLSGDAALLERAVELGDRLLPAVRGGGTGLPFSDVDLRSGQGKARRPRRAARRAAVAPPGSAGGGSGKRCAAGQGRAAAGHSAGLVRRSRLAAAAQGPGEGPAGGRTRPTTSRSNVCRSVGSLRMAHVA